jgi:hypothetical protein
MDKTELSAGGCTRIRTLDPLIKSPIASAADQWVGCKTSQNPRPEIKGLQAHCKTLDTLLRVALVQLPRLSAEDRAALLPYVKREMERAGR